MIQLYKLYLDNIKISQVKIYTNPFQMIFVNITPLILKEVICSAQYNHYKKFK